MKKKQTVQISPYAEKVMQLGNTYRYRPLQVNSSLSIGSGPESWYAYAVLATEKRIGQIEQAIERKR